ncbi:NYN domain-containing protein [Elusimicrobiota bacterium]
MGKTKIEKLYAEKLEEVKICHADIEKHKQTQGRLEKEIAQLKKALEKTRCSGDEGSVLRVEIESLQSKLADIEAQNRKLCADNSQLKENQRILKKTGIFVDVENIRLGLRGNPERSLDWKELLSELEHRIQNLPEHKHGYAVSDKHAFLPRQSRVAHFFREQGYEIHEKEPNKKTDTVYVCNWDIGLALEVADIAQRLDAVALVTGDGDFVDLLKWLEKRHNNRLRYILAGVKGSISVGIQELAAQEKIHLIELNSE